MPIMCETGDFPVRPSSAIIVTYQFSHPAQPGTVADQETNIFLPKNFSIFFHKLKRLC